MTSESPAVFSLDHLKHDWFEKNQDIMVVTLYIKQAKKDSIHIVFKEKSISVSFSTQNTQFLKLHEGTNEDTVFEWAITVVDSLKTDACSYKVKAITIELQLHKKEPRKWNCLELSYATGPNFAASSAVTPQSSWVSTSNKPATPTENKAPPTSKPATPTENKAPPTSKPATPTENKAPPTSAKGKHKVAFDEMSGDMADCHIENKKKPALISEPESPKFQKKPTCKVSPQSKDSWDGSLVQLGMTGLDNLGNTCFMNSVIQVLANTTQLRDFFIDGSFQRELNGDNPLGSGGKLAVSFAVLLKVLWSGKHYSYAPAKLKTLISMKWTQFTGFAQHDAQEFMAFLLDGLHEDLNRVREKPYTETVESNNRPDEVVANEAWEVHRKRNDSFIMDNLQGQFKSKLVCPVCGKVSITFDPFNVLSVPLPKKKRLLCVTFMHASPHKEPTKYKLVLPRDASVEQLKEAVCQKTGVQPSNMLVFEAYKHSIHQFFKKGASLGTVNHTDDILVCEFLSEKIVGEPVVKLVFMQRLMVPQMTLTYCSYCKKECPEGAKLKRCTRCYRTAYCDQECQRRDWQSRHRTLCGTAPEFVGQPFCISLPQSTATYSRLVYMVEAFSRYSVDIFQPPVEDLSSESGQGETSAPTTPRGADGDPTNPFPASGEGSRSDSDPLSSPESDTPSKRTGFVVGTQQDVGDQAPPLFFLRPVDKDGRNAQGTQTQPLVDQGDSPLDLSNTTFLAVDWKNHHKYKPYALVKSKDLDYREDSSMHTEALDVSNVCSLDHCMSLFSEPEVLSPEDAWYCPSCKKHQEATKQLSIWRLPHILIIQLKRFSFRNLLWRDKIDKMVEFPTRNLDLEKFYLGKRPSNEPPAFYDLYGVVNHHGGILGGHYTSFARCPSLNEDKPDEYGWRLFDDSMVSRTMESKVTTPAAYLLFYTRRPYETPLPASVTMAENGHGEEEPVEEMEINNYGTPHLSGESETDESDSEGRVTLSTSSESEEEEGMEESGQNENLNIRIKDLEFELLGQGNMGDVLNRSLHEENKEELPTYKQSDLIGGEKTTSAEERQEEEWYDCKEDVSPPGGSRAEIAGDQTSQSPCNASKSENFQTQHLKSDIPKENIVNKDTDILPPDGNTERNSWPQCERETPGNKELNFDDNKPKDTVLPSKELTEQQAMEEMLSYTDMDTVD